MGSAPVASNTNFPAPLAVVGFLAAWGGFLFVGGLALIFWFARMTRAAITIALSTIAVGAVIYLALLLGFSAGSRETDLAREREKICYEIDCHLAYSVADARLKPDGNYLVTLRTRFDETTTSPTRPQDATLTPSPRGVRLTIVDRRRPRVRSRQRRRHAARHPSEAQGLLYHATGIQSPQSRHRPASAPQNRSAMARLCSHWRRKQLAAQKDLLCSLGPDVQRPTLAIAADSQVPLKIQSPP